MYEELCQFTVSSTSLVKAVDAKAKVSEATSKAARSGIRKEADHSASKSKEKGTDHLKKREEKRPPKVLEPIAVDGDEPALDPKLVAAVGACLNNLTDDLFDMLHTDSSLGLSVFGKRFFREDGRFEKLEGEIGLVGVAAVCGAADTVERLMEEGVSPCTGISPYLSTKSKAVRNRLRTFWAKHPDLYDYAQAGIPSPLTAADLEAQAERERAKRRKDKQKKKDKALERAEAVKPPEQRAREMRAAAAEARMLGNRCGACRKSLSGIAPFERLAFKYCSTACVSNHRKILSQM